MSIALIHSIPLFFFPISCGSVSLSPSSYPKEKIHLTAQDVVYTPSRYHCRASGEVFFTKGHTKISGYVLDIFFDHPTAHTSASQVVPVSAPPKALLYKAIFQGHSHLQEPGLDILGDTILYDFRKNYLKVSGKSPTLKASSSTYSILLKGSSLLYYPKEKKGEAHGDVFLTWNDASITAPHLSATFYSSGSDDGTLQSSSSFSLKEVQGYGGVLWIQKDLRIFAKEISFIAATSTIYASGNVSIRQGKNILTGDSGTFSLLTHKAHITSQQSNGQVRGIWYPSSTNIPQTSKKQTSSNAISSEIILFFSQNIKRIFSHGANRQKSLQNFK